MIQVRASGGGGLPADWTEEVTATALENIAKDAPVEYRMFPGNDVFNGQLEVFSRAASVVRYSGDRKYRAYISPNGTKSTVFVEKFDNGSYVTIFTAPNQSYDASDVAISSTGRYVFCLSYRAIMVYETTDGTNYNQVASLTTTYGSYVCMEFLLDLYLVVGRNMLASNGPCVYAYKFVNNTLTPLAITGVPSGDDYRAVNMSFSADATYCAFVYNSDGTNKYYHVGLMKRNGDSFLVFKSNTDIYRSTNYVGCAAISPDASRFSYAHSSTAFMSHYTLVNDIITPISNPDVVPAAAITTMYYSPDGRYLYVSCGASPYFLIYAITLPKYIKLANPPVLPTGSANFISVEKNGKYLTYGSLVYITGVGAYIMPLRSRAQGQFLYSNHFGYFGVGISKNSALAGEPCTAIMLKKINDVSAQ